ncbi:MAG TPA: nucleotide sugar dehydrogenase, partial [Candidatus Norongarragalinales archaeon]|nr:nucleotide sugar dehydrogenase [Candidatus Norongarragalinales archaeon]
MSALLEKIRDKSARIGVVGVGYVGLPNVVLFAQKGFSVIAADTNPRVVEFLHQGKSHIKDPELEQSVPNAFKTGRISATTDVTSAANQCDVLIISVPTPAEKKEPDLRFVEQSAASIGVGLKKNALVVLESTVYPGACKEVLCPILEEKSGLKAGTDFYIAHCPERMNPGDPNHTIFNTPRIVGGIDDASMRAAEALYCSVGLTVKTVANLQTAELVKLVENTQRDVNIA